MMKRVTLLLAVSVCSAVLPAQNVVVDVNRSIHSISDGFISFALDAEVFGNPESKAEWPVIRMNFSDPVMKAMVKLIAPGHLRIGGTYSDYIIYMTGSSPPTCPPHWNKTMCPHNSWPCCLPLTMKRWGEMLAFGEETGTRVGLNINDLFGKGFPSRGTPTELKWDPHNARDLIEYTVNHIHPHQLPTMYGMGNELWDVVRPEDHAADLVTLHGLILDAYANSTAQRPFLFAPDMWDSADGLQYDETFLKNLPTGVLGAYAYHLYTGKGSTQSYLEQALITADFHDEYEERLAAHRALLDKVYPSAELWITETASSAHAPVDGPASDGMLKAVDSLWFVNALGGAAAHRHDVVCKETLAGDWLETLASYWRGNPSDIEYHPHPDFWVAAMFHKVMGTRVLNVTSGRVGKTLRVFVHCPADKSSTHSLAVLAANVDKSSQGFRLAELGGAQKGTAWMLTPGPDLSGDQMMLNGKLLMVGSDGSLPSLDGQPLDCPRGLITVPPLSFLFAEVEMDGAVPACS